MTITTLQTILLTALIFIWLCFSVVFLITSIQSAIYDRKREKREREQAARDLEPPEAHEGLQLSDRERRQGSPLCRRPPTRDGDHENIIYRYRNLLRHQPCQGHPDLPEASLGAARSRLNINALYILFSR